MMMIIHTERIFAQIAVQNSLSKQYFSELSRKVPAHFSSQTLLLFHYEVKSNFTKVVFKLLKFKELIIQLNKWVLLQWCH